VEQKRQTITKWNLTLVKIINKNKIMENYIGSQQHWEDRINYDYEYRKNMEKENDKREQEDNRTKPDLRQQKKTWKSQK
jgi:hypothetical protein